MKNHLIKCLVFELVTIVLVTLTFILISNHLLAGRIAGSFFLLTGIFVCFRGLSSLKFRRTKTFPFGVIHLFLSLSMIITRIFHSEGSFANITILGIPGPIYHKLSTLVYICLILSTSIDIYKLKQKK
jgi:hypothetical protein